MLLRICWLHLRRLIDILHIISGVDKLLQLGETRLQTPHTWIASIARMFNVRTYIVLYNKILMLQLLFPYSC